MFRNNVYFSPRAGCQGRGAGCNPAPVLGAPRQIRQRLLDVWVLGPGSTGAARGRLLLRQVGQHTLCSVPCAKYPVTLALPAATLRAVDMPTPLPEPELMMV